jgi:uncharacterized protein (DUF305 family)
MVDTESPHDDARMPGDDDIDDHGHDDVLVLPWWQHPLNILTLFVAIALVAGMVGWLVGDTRSQPSGSEVDVGFLQDMREHHEQAITMSFIFLDLDDTGPGLRTVARSIVFGQALEIGRMIQMLRDFGAPEVNEGDTSMTWMGMSSAVGSMPGMASREQLDQLAASEGTEADEIFVELMVAHHLGGVDMARYAMNNGDDREVRAMAASIVSQQQSEVIELRQLLD